MMIDEMFVSSDHFLRLPKSAQSLYYHLISRANNASHVINLFAVCRLVDASEEDYKLLLKHEIIEEPECIYGIDIKV